MFNVTCENQRRADERIPLLLALPARHKGIMCAPLIGPVSIRDHLPAGQIEQVLCEGENYGGSRPCRYEWVKTLRAEPSGLPLRSELSGPADGVSAPGHLGPTHPPGGAVCAVFRPAVPKLRHEALLQRLQPLRKMQGGIA